MNKAELTELLLEIAEKDTTGGHNIQDHPCSVAVRALDACFEDIRFLQRIANEKVHGKSKRAKMLLGLNYEPGW